MKIYLDDNFNPVEVNKAVICKIIPENGNPYFRIVNRPNGNTKLVTAIIDAADWLEARGVNIPLRLQAGICKAVKTYAHFVRVLSSGVRDLYRGEISESDFVTIMQDLIPEQLTRAWHEGMRANGLDPVEDMEDEWAAKLEEIILNEYNYVDGFAADIVATRDAGQPWDQLLARAEMWANRYNDVVNQAIMITKEQKLEWIYGDTEHCDTCAYLNGTVARSSIWDLSGRHPQQPPNEALTCGGWHCQCRLEPTDKRQTRGAFEYIMGAP